MDARRPGFCKRCQRPWSAGEAIEKLPVVGWGHRSCATHGEIVKNQQWKPGTWKKGR